MDYWYSGQVRKYILQIIRLLSNFSVKQSDGTLIRVPVTYGDMDRQVASILSQNSENALLSGPKIAVYISDLDLDRDRLGDATFVGKVHIRERGIENGVYTGDQGGNYTVERLMPTPFKMAVKVDIWASSTDQKLQILEQILMFFNPSLEIQTSDNYLDWSSLSVVDLTDVSFTSRTIPVGTTTTIDVATISLETPIWISPPAKVKKMGVITKVITNLYDDIDPGDEGYLEGLGVSLGDPDPFPANLITSINETIGNYDINVAGKNVLALSNSQQSRYVSWYHIVEQLPGNYQPGLVKIYLMQPDGSEVIGYGSINVLDETIMTISTWDSDTFPANTAIPGPSRAQASWGSFDAVVDPLQSGPRNLVNGTRYLLVNSIGGGVRETLETTELTASIETNTNYTKVNFYTFLVDGVEYDSAPLSTVLYDNLPTQIILGAGAGATFNITANLPSNSYTGTIVNAGTGYTVGSRLKIKGSLLGGAIMENDCIVSVLAVDVDGAITSFRTTGTIAPRNFTIVPVVPVAAGKEVSYELFMNVDGPDAWKNADATDFVAEPNDIIEWDGAKWHVVFSADETKTIAYQTNLHTLTQYKWTGSLWTRAFEGEYTKGNWRITL